MPNRFDVSIDGVEYRLTRGEGSYSHGASRQMVDFQEIEGLSGSQYTSRNDKRTFFQTSWAGGARWEKPLMSQENADTYFRNNGLDLLASPGDIVPIAISTSTDFTHTDRWSKWVQIDHETAYAVGQDGTTYKAIAKWLDGTLSTITEHSNVVNASDVFDMCWSEDDATLYILSDGEITYCTPGTGQGAVLSRPTSRGACIFMHFGELWYYSGSHLYIVDDPLGTPVATLMWTDGWENDWMETIDTTATEMWHYPWSSTLAISTADGIFVVKNVSQRGVVMPYIYRVDRDALGTYIGTPVATLDAGTVALDIFWSLGSLLISATTDFGVLGTNDADEPAPKVDFFHLTQGSLGSIGSPDGDNPSDFPFKMMFSYNSAVFVGGTEHIYAYDTIRGGMHTYYQNFALGDAHYHSGIVAKDGLHVANGGDDGRQALTHIDTTGVVGSGGGVHAIESSHFDFSLPGEEKYITEITVMLDDIQEDETWRIYLTPDEEDTVWSSASLVATITSGGTQKITLPTPVGGYRFRYKVSQSNVSLTGIAPSRMQGIIFSAISGEMVPYWQLMIDGSEARNVENEIVRPEDVFDNLLTLRDNLEQVTFIDNYESDDRSDSTSHDVRVHSVTITKEEPKESVAQVTLVGT